MPKGTNTDLKPVYTYKDDEVSIVVRPMNFEGYKRSVENKWLIKHYLHKYYQDNKEYFADKTKKWIAEHPEKYKIIKKKYNNDYRLKKKIKEEEQKK